MPTGALKFKDKRDVTMLSTIHNEEIVQGRRNAAQQKPKCISDYKRDVTMLSTIHNEEIVQGRRNAAQQKPKCISDYNKYMGGVDRTDQLLQPYEIARKSLKWYKKLAIHFL